MLPRWRYSVRTELTAEHGSDDRPEKEEVRDHDYVNFAIEAFGTAPALATATELVSAAFVYGRLTEAQPAAEWLLKHRESAKPDVVLASEHILTVAEGKSSLVNELPIRKEAYSIIATNRIRLREYPRNVVRWLDTSRAYAVLGLGSQAWQAMRTGLALAPNHRVVQRRGARLLVHLDRADEALSQVLSNPLLRSDPWLMALEITLSQICEKEPRSYRVGHSFVEQSAASPRHLTELAGALGTYHFMQGELKRARKLLRVAQQAPTENTLAQIEWLAHSDTSLKTNWPASFSSRFAAEANFWQSLRMSRWSDALTYAQAWQQDESFSGRPAILGSYVALSLLGDAELAAKIAEEGLIADPNDPMLRNNYAVALAYAGWPKAAYVEFAKIQIGQKGGLPTHVRAATAGLIAFGLGDAELGRSLYRRAMEVADSRTRPIVLSHWIAAETSCDLGRAELLQKQLRDEESDIKDPVYKEVVARALRPLVDVANSGPPSTRLDEHRTIQERNFPEGPRDLNLMLSAKTLNLLRSSGMEVRGEPPNPSPESTTRSWPIPKDSPIGGH